VDVSLDTFPHNGGVTSVESLLMGVPTVTTGGDYLCGRVGLSLMAAFGLSHAVARSPIEYISHAVGMAEDTWTLGDRQALRRRVTKSILMDEDAYASAFEDAVRVAWREWCHGR